MARSLRLRLENKLVEQSPTRQTADRRSSHQEYAKTSRKVCVLVTFANIYSAVPLACPRPMVNLLAIPLYPPFSCTWLSWRVLVS